MDPTHHPRPELFGSTDLSTLTNRMSSEQPPHARRFVKIGSSVCAVVWFVLLVMLSACGGEDLGPVASSDMGTAENDPDGCGLDCDDSGSADVPVDLAADEQPEADLPQDEPAPALHVAISVAGGLETTQGLVLSGRTVVTASVTGGFAPLGVEFQVDGFRIDTDLIPPYNAIVDTLLFEDGLHTLAVATADTVGDTASDSIVLRFDNHAPEFLNKGPVDGQTLFFEDGPIQMSVEVDDPVAVQRVSFRANGLLLQEFESPPYETAVEYSAVYVDEEDLPATLLLQHEAADLVGQVTTESAVIQIVRRLAWVHESLGEIWASPVILPDGSVVFGNKNNTLRALNPDGTEAWSATLDDMIEVGPAVDPVANRIFVGSASGSVYAIGAQNGSVAWTIDIGTPPSGDIVFLTDTFYVAGFSGLVLARNAATGANRWSYTLPANIFASPAVAADGTVYIGCQDGFLYALKNGEVLWQFETGDEVWGTPVIGPDGEIYVGSNDGWLYALDSAGERIWAQELEGQIWSRPLLDVDDGAVYAGSTARNVHRLDIETGARQWRTRTSGLTRSSPQLGENGDILIGTTSGEVLALDSITGAVTWQYEVGGTIHGNLLLAPNRLFVGSTNRNFYSLWTSVPETE